MSTRSVRAHSASLRDRSDDGALLEELDRLKEILSAVTPDGVDRLEVTTRLEVILRDWRDGENASTDTSDQGLETATDDEMFELIDKELGTPGT